MSSDFNNLMCGPFEASPSSTTMSFRCGCSRRTSASIRFAALRSQSFFVAPSPFTMGSGASAKTSRCSGCTTTAPSIWWEYVTLPFLWWVSQHCSQCTLGEEKYPVPSTESR